MGVQAGKVVEQRGLMRGLCACVCKDPIMGLAWQDLHDNRAASAMHSPCGRTCALAHPHAPLHASCGAGCLACCGCGGAHHSGVEVNGVEYYFGGHPSESLGISGIRPLHKLREEALQALATEGKRPPRAKPCAPGARLGLGAGSARSAQCMAGPEGP